MTGDWRCLPRDRFGDTPELQDELAALVLAGRKTASCCALADAGNIAQGYMSVIEDGSGRPVCVIETVTVEHRRFCDVDAAFAQAEGEGDLSLAYWQSAHRDFFTRNGGFAEDMMLVCETFRVVRLIAP